MSGEIPPGIDLDRHANPDNRKYGTWWRRVGVIVFAVIPIFGLLNFFGQRTQTTHANSAQASMLIKSPTHLRGGLMFDTEIVVTPHSDINDGQIYLNNGWFEDMTLNAVSPQPSNQNAQGNWQIWDFGPMQANQAFTVFISWQVNPTKLGSHPQAVELYDGSNQLMSVYRSYRVFP